jgi:hypothetical protein
MEMGMPASDQDSFVTIAAVGQLLSRCNNVENARRGMGKAPPQEPRLDLNKGVSPFWIHMAQEMGIPEKAHELPVIFQAGCNSRDPYLKDLLKQFLTMAKLGCTSELEKHRADIQPRQRQFAERDRTYQKELENHKRSQAGLRKKETECMAQVHTSWKHLMHSLEVALQRVDDNPARLSDKDAQTVEILKRRGFVDVKNHSVQVHWGTLATLDCARIHEIIRALLSSLKGVERA